MKIQVMYRPEMVGPPASKTMGSPSSAKPAQVVEHWELLHDNLINVQAFDPVAKTDFYSVHKRSYVDGVFSHREKNGFGTIDKDVTRTLPYTSGSMLAAARVALRDGVACSPTSGFHHAHHGSGGGFCTFNGLALTAMSVLDDLGDKAVVAIIDCDYHYGDGTQGILDKLRGRQGSPARRVIHETAGAVFSRHGGSPPSVLADEFLTRWLPAALNNCLMADVDLVLYQAGADPHINDPYGGFLTTEQLRKRDEIVFSSLAGRIPVAWNLAGGYQQEEDGSIPEVLRIHENTLLAAAAAQEKKR